MCGPDGRRRWTHACLNALVAGGRCAGFVFGRSPRQDGAFLSQCPCCGRSMCGGLLNRRGHLLRVGLNALVAGGRCAGDGKSCTDRGVRRGGSQCPCCGRSMCGYLLPATCSRQQIRSQCPCCGRSMCGPPRQECAQHAQAVSMPLLRAVDVRGLGVAQIPSDLGGMLSQCPCCGRSMCGGGYLAAASRRLSQCPCCGRSMCGSSGPPRLRQDRVSCPCCGRSCAASA